MRVAGPVEAAVYVVVQVALGPLPASVQVVNPPVLLVNRATLPVGVVGAVAFVSVTVTAQLVTLLATTVVGWHVIVEVVVCPGGGALAGRVASSFVVR